MKKRPRILFIQTQAENAGAQEISRVLADGLVPRGYDVHHLFFYRKSDVFEPQPQTVFCSIERPNTPWAFAGFLFRLVRLIRQIQPDIVFTFQHYGNMFGAPAARLAGVRHVIANQVSAPEMISKPALLADKLWGNMGIYDKITVNTADTGTMYADYSDRYRELIEHVPHGFREKVSDLTQQQARNKFGLPDKAPLLGTVARLNKLKRVDVSIRALCHDPDWHLALGGHGPEEANLRALAVELGVAERVHFIGELDPVEIGDLLKAIDVFVFPSISETFGLAPVEAAQTGLPVVANALPVLREVLQTSLGPCALFADTDNPDSYAEPIRTLLEDRDTAEAIFNASRELRKLYALDAMVDRYEGLIGEQMQQDLHARDLAAA